MAAEFIKPTQRLPRGLNIVTTTRRGGRSADAFATFNLADHVGDTPAVVTENRERLRRVLALPEAPRWIQQVHGTNVIDAALIHCDESVIADASYTNERNIVCAILTADCLPIVIWNDEATELATIHAGWRGLFNDIVGASIARFSVAGSSLNAWIGPGISAAAYQVDEAFRARFVRHEPHLADAFTSIGGRLHANLSKIAHYRLKNFGIRRIETYDGCCFEETERFFSYRRDGVTGRMATLAWIAT